MFENYLTEYGSSVVGGALFLTAACIFAVWVDRGTRHVLIQRAKLDPAVAVVLARTLRISIWVLASVAVLEELGVEISSLIAALGIFGFAIAIGFRTTANNFFTGVMLFILKPYKVGDYIDGERVVGAVESMSLFHTVLVTEDGTFVAVPNGAMWSRSVKNFSRPRPRRFELNISVGRTVPFEEFSSVIDRTFSEETALVAEFAPLIRIVTVSEKELIVSAAAWCDVRHTWDVTQRLSAALRDNLASAGVEVHDVGVAEKSRTKKKKAAPAADDDD